ncbi:ATP synthase subunit a [Mycolicibacterium madagascariense]|uniref:ATP synthase subunit a n=1 Tax=Mycolicibacterium madagascariense TaxID=212765 RepID=A0A7I7XKN5_9MYCO|nr:F0F1 ATP synthase subunit A [Mycolicibacterium madagascariense]MCV7011572.1 F0F1 ATP synthase subunit A [Mycolicibacterium madagascariense]BBZ29757.1 ATP synthase subunit a [Mycolicibacterium madagascariense]
MNEQVVAAGAIHVGEHDEVHWLGLTFNLDTITATAVAAVIVIGLAFFLRAKVTSTDVPGGVQLFFEAITIQMRNQVESAIGIRVAPFVLPLAVALFVFILISNWLSVLPVQYSSGGETHELLKPPAADINFVLALALFVFLCYHAAGIWRRGFFKHWVKVLKGHVAFMAPINLVEEIAKPISLSLRLFGNLFAGGILVTLIAALIPTQFMWAPNAIWKLFDLFVGLIQAFIFALLTILYFSQSMELDHDDEHAEGDHDEGDHARDAKDAKEAASH